MTQPIFAETIPDANDEQKRAQELARRYRCEYVQLKGFRVQHELFRKVPVRCV